MQKLLSVTKLITVRVKNNTDIKTVIIKIWSEYKNTKIVFNVFHFVVKRTQNRYCIKKPHVEKQKTVVRHRGNKKRRKILKQIKQITKQKPSSSLKHF